MVFFRTNAFPRFLAPMKTAPRTLGRYFTHRGLTSIRGLVLDFKLPIYQGFWPMISGHSRGADFRVDPSKSPCFIRFSAIYDPFGTPIFSRIFPSIFQSGSHHGIHGSLVVCDASDHGWNADPFSTPRHLKSYEKGPRVPLLMGRLPPGAGLFAPTNEILPV
jgi:hypothetical protein